MGVVVTVRTGTPGRLLGPARSDSTTTQLESQLRAIDLPQISSLYQQATKVASSSDRLVPGSAATCQATGTAKRVAAVKQPWPGVSRHCVLTKQQSYWSPVDKEVDSVSKNRKGFFQLDRSQGVPCWKSSLIESRQWSRRYDSCLPLYMMTSPETDQPIRDFLEQHHYFGRGPGTGQVVLPGCHACR